MELRQSEWEARAAAFNELRVERDKLRRSWEQLLEDAENPQARAYLSLNEILSRGRAALSSSDSGEPSA